MVDYDFIEIGTADIDTLIQECPSDSIGISVEPVKEYLDSLPTKENVKKINCAISIDDFEGEGEIFYIPVNILKENNLRLGLRGCNKVNEYHPRHIAKGITHLVQTYKIKLIPISKLLIENKVKGIKHLKIDTEGDDCYIIKNLFKYLEDKSKEFYPKKITFETNRLTKKELIEETISMLEDKNYIVVSEISGNTVVILQ
jgi:hypothetical protein